MRAPTSSAFRCIDERDRRYPGNSLSAVALFGLLVAVIDDRKRQQQIADGQWKEIEGE